MANMDLVTSHRGVAHITTQNVIDLLAGLSGDISGVKIFPNLYNGLAHEITTSTRVQLKPGAGLAGGYFFILNSLYNWDLDPGAVGYSRNDVLFLVIYENFGSLVQSCDLVYQAGLPYPNGSEGNEPQGIGGANILACYKLLRAVMTDGAIVSVTSLAEEYNSNDVILQALVDNTTRVNTIESDLHNAFFVKTFQSQEYTLAPHQSTGENISINEEGYIPVAIVGIDMSNIHVNLSKWRITRFNEITHYEYAATVNWSNETDEDRTGYARVYVLFINENIIPTDWWKG